MGRSLQSSLQRALAWAAFLAQLIALIPAATAQALAPDTGGSRIGEREAPADDVEAASRLKSLLPAWAATAHRYENYALKFLCTESHRTIDYSRSAGEARSEKEIPYGYLLTLDAKTNSFEVVRQTLDSEKRPTGSERTIDLASPEPYMWTFMFLPSLASTFRFHYLGREIQDYRLTHVVTFEGAAPHQEGKDIREWSGTVWVEENSGNIVRVEARPSFQNERILAVWRAYQQSFSFPLGFRGKSRPHGYALAVVFDFERDGLLFPSRLDLSDFTWVATNSEAMDTRLVLLYDDYRFFKTATEEKVESPSPPGQAPRPN